MASNHHHEFLVWRLCAAVMRSRGGGAIALTHDCGFILGRDDRRGRQLDRRCPGGHRWRRARGHQPRDGCARRRDSRWPQPADVDARRRLGARRPARLGRATPADRSAVLAKLAKLADEAADVLVAEEVSQTGKPVRLADRVRCAGQRRQHRLLRGRRASPRGQGHRGVLRRSHVEHPARGRRCRRDHHAVELPAADGGVEGVARLGRRLLRRHQACRDHPADDADAGPPGQRGRAARRGVQCGDRRRLRCRHRAGRPPRCRHGDLHGVDRRSAAR